MTCEKDCRNSFKPLNKIEVLKMDCQKHTTYNIKTWKTCIKKKNDQDCGKKKNNQDCGKKKLEGRII